MSNNNINSTNPGNEVSAETESFGVNENVASEPQSSEQQIFVLFQAAAVELDKIDTQARGQKTKVVQDLARELEGKIPTDTIATGIIHRLHGRVSERLVHDCLEEKYKRKQLVDNAKRQKRRKQIPNTGFAAPVPLEQREIIIDTGGNETIADDFTDQRSMHDGVFGTDEGQDKGSKKCNNCDVLQGKCEQLQLKLVEYEDIVKTQTLMRTAEEITHRTTDGYLQFQFSIQFERLRLHMLHSSNFNRVWFTGKLNPETAKVVDVQVLEMAAMYDRHFDDTSNDTTRHQS